MELEQEEEHVSIMSLSPYQIKQLLLSILVHKQDECDHRTPLQRRQLDGALSRVPKDFYERVWQILERTPGGIKVAGYLLPQVSNKLYIILNALSTPYFHKPVTVFFVNKRITPLKFYPHVFLKLYTRFCNCILSEI